MRIPGMLLVTLAALTCQPALADDTFSGIVQKRPATKAGQWVVGERTLQVTAAANLEDKGIEFKVGDCVEVAMDGAVVEEIERLDPRECGRPR